MLTDELDKVIGLFGKVKLQEDQLPQQEQDELLARIHTSVSTRNRKKQLFIGKWSRLAVAASILLLMGIGSYFFLKNPVNEESIVLSADLIIGENLEEKEIYLITDNQTSSFAKDVYIELDENGAAIVRELNSDKSERVTTATSAMNKLVVPYGKQSRLILADGTKVWVNSGSVLEFPAVFSGKERTVNLAGEMYIEVAKDESKPFFVNTKQFRVQVYGTKFNISAYHESISNSVVLVEGSVGVQGIATDETRLQPNDMLTVAAGGWEKSQVNVSLYTTWKDGYILFNQTPIDEVLRTDR
ncbi:MAG: FecR domain-containing protein [Tannerellaceae bacterium]|nr:FecR domain-containing protein [Tannerellaceae bacterium]